MKRFLLAAVAAAGLATGCYTQGDVGAGYSYGYANAGYGYAAPDMYVMSNGVNVVAYADYPTFYSDNYYWQFNNGLWYRSNYYGGGWAVTYDVPYRIRSIDRPYSYARFRPGAGWTRARTPVGYGRPGYQQPGTVRDHRTYRGGYTPSRTNPTYNGNVRDHRTSRPAPVYQPAPAPVRDHRRAAPSTYSPPPARSNAPARSAPPAGPRVVPRGGPPIRDHRR